MYSISCDTYKYNLDRMTTEEIVKIVKMITHCPITGLHCETINIGACAWNFNKGYISQMK